MLRDPHAVRDTALKSRADGGVTRECHERQVAYVAGTGDTGIVNDGVSYWHHQCVNVGAIRTFWLLIDRLRTIRAVRSI